MLSKLKYLAVPLMLISVSGFGETFTCPKSFICAGWTCKPTTGSFTSGWTVSGGGKSEIYFFTQANSNNSTAWCTYIYNHTDDLRQSVQLIYSSPNPNQVTGDLYSSASTGHWNGGVCTSRNATDCPMLVKQKPN